MRYAPLLLFPLCFLACENFTGTIPDGDTASLADADAAPEDADMIILPDEANDGWPVTDGDELLVMDEDAPFSDEDILLIEDTASGDDGDVPVEADELPEDDVLSDPAVVWVRVWGTERVDGGHSVGVDAAGDIYVAGIAGTDMDGQNGPGAICSYKTYTFPCSDLFITKWRDDGTKVWTRLWGSYTMDTQYDLAVDASESIYSLGSGMVAKFDGDGDESWRVTGSEGAGTLTAAAPTTDGVYLMRVLEEAIPEDPGTVRRTFTLSHRSAAGALEWEKDVTPADPSVFFGLMAMGGSGEIALAGSMADDHFDENGYPLTDVYLARYSATGDLLWDLRWDGGHDDMPIALAFDADDNIYLLGVTNVLTQRGPDQYQFPYPFLKKFGPDGVELWEKRMDLFVGFDFDGGIALGADGRVHAAGARGHAIFVATFEPDGTPVTVRSIDTQYLDGTVADIAVDPEGYLYVTGVTYEHTAMGLEDIYLMKIAPDLP